MAADILDPIADDAAAPLSGAGLPAEAIRAVLEAAGGLSVIVQGALLRSDAARLAANCRHWRALFPTAQLVCAVSSTDCLAEIPPGGELIDRFVPARGSRGDKALRAALESIAASVDCIVFGVPAQPLPPVKSDNSSLNHTNLMIAAACAGLARSNGRYVLRIRNDLLFGDLSFVDHYAVGLHLPRGDWAVFGQRVMVAEVFTLNPLTISHMPFHFSDWFHFGLADDVRSLWQAARPTSAEDATFYEAHAFAPGTTAVERRYRSRLAPEQMVSFPLFDRRFSSLRLDYHNDVTCAEDSLRVLADNFVIANLAECRARIDKYQRMIDQPTVGWRLEWMSQDLVEQLARRQAVPARTLFAGLIRRARQYERVGKPIRLVWRANLYFFLRLLPRWFGA